MSTNLIKLRPVENFIDDFKPLYSPVWPLLINDGRSEKHSMEVGLANFIETTTIGDIRNRRIDPKTTELHQIHASDTQKQFKKYFAGSQYKQSNLQSTRGYERIVGEALDEHNRQFDELLAGGQNDNNGFLISSDPNFVTKASGEVKKGTDSSYLHDLYSKISGVLDEAAKLEGQLIVFLYGATTTAKYKALFQATERPFNAVLGEAYPNVSINMLPDGIPTGTTEGFAVLNLDHFITHYITVPTVDGQGVNEEKKYAWTNFTLGSAMVDVRTKGGIIVQPLTYEA